MNREESAMFSVPVSLRRCVVTQASVGRLAVLRRRGFFVPLLVSLVALVGCQVRTYELEMTPREGQLERRLTVFEQRPDGEKSVEVAVEDKELARIAAEYGVAPPKSGGPRHAFSQEFAGRLPDDVGGFGTYTRWATSLGTATAYVERMRGDDDIASDLDARREAVERLVELLAGWLEQEMSDTPQWPPLRVFLHDQFRRDLVNLSIYVKSLEFLAARERQGTAGDQPDRTDILAEHGVRIGQYFVERGYLVPDQLPDWLYAVDQAQQRRSGPLLALVQRWLATRCGVPADQPLPPSLTRFNDLESVRDSLRSYLQDSDEYRSLRTKWEQLPPADRDGEPPAPEKVLGDLALRAFVPGGILFGSDRLTATLAVPCEPLATNGRWQADEQRIAWTADLLPRGKSTGETFAGRPIPDILFTIWVEPAEEAQRARFGRVVLAKEELAEYCLWRCGLPEEKARLWEAFLETLEPGAELNARIQAFRFADEPEDCETPSASRKIRETLVQRLQ
jgi:hypothetical protein